jgi:hypothetical protein
VRRGEREWSSAAESAESPAVGADAAPRDWLRGLAVSALWGLGTLLIAGAVAAGAMLVVGSVASVFVPGMLLLAATVVCVGGVGVLSVRVAALRYRHWQQGPLDARWRWLGAELGLQSAVVLLLGAVVISPAVGKRIGIATSPSVRFAARLAGSGCSAVFAGPAGVDTAFGVVEAGSLHHDNGITTFATMYWWRCVPPSEEPGSYRVTLTVNTINGADAPIRHTELALGPWFPHRSRRRPAAADVELWWGPVQSVFTGRPRYVVLDGTLRIDSLAVVPPGNDGAPGVHATLTATVRRRIGAFGRPRDGT